MTYSVVYLVGKGMGWKNGGKWYWDVYIENVQGQPSLAYGVCYSEQEAEAQGQRNRWIEERKLNESKN